MKISYKKLIVIVMIFMLMGFLLGFGYGIKYTLDWVAEKAAAFLQVNPDHMRIILNQYFNNGGRIDQFLK